MIGRAITFAAALALAGALALRPAAAEPPPPSPPTAEAPAPPRAAAATARLTITLERTVGGLVQASGTLVDPAGAPIPAAGIELSHDGRPYARAVTDAAGAWSQLARPGGALTNATHVFTAAWAGDGTSPAVSTEALLHVGPRATLLVVDTAPEARPAGSDLRLEGLLTTDTGEPVPGAVIACGIDDPTASSGEAVTDEGGRFVLFAVAPVTETTRPMALHIRFEGAPDYRPVVVTLHRELRAASPSPSPTPPATPTPASPSPTVSTASPAATTTVGGAATSAGEGWSLLPPGLLIPLLVTLVVAVAGLALVGGVAYAWHRRDLGSRRH